MKTLKARWAGFSRRERHLITLMLLLAGGLFLWLAIWRPLQTAEANARARYAAALDSNADVSARVAALKAVPGNTARASIAQSASDAGLTLDRSAPLGPGRLAITIGSARAGAALAWLAGLEANGVRVEAVSMTPGVTPGTVAVQALLREPPR